MIAPRVRAFFLVVLMLLIAGGLLLLFPRAFALVELAARELRYLWWIVLLVALALWLIWGIGRKPK